MLRPNKGIERTSEEKKVQKKLITSKIFSKCDKCSVKTQEAMIECDICMMWMCIKCSGIKDEGKVRDIGEASKTAGVSWKCTKCRREEAEVIGNYGPQSG